MFVLNDGIYQSQKIDNFWNTPIIKTNSTIQPINNQKYSKKKILKYNNNKLNNQYNNEKTEKTEKNSRTSR
jgi:hypothetical protein